MREPIDAEGAPVLAVAVPGDQIPAAAEVDERVRFDFAATVGALPASIGKAKAFGVAARGCDHRQMLRVDGRAADHRRDSRRAQGADATAKVSRQHMFELDQCPHCGLLDPGHGRAGGGTEADRDRDRLVVVEQQRRHRRSGAKPVAAGGTGERLDRVAENAQPLDVSPDRPARHREPVGELGSQPVATCLEQRQELQESTRGRGHGAFIIAEIEDRS
jgi:hypothetical protein